MAIKYTWDVEVRKVNPYNLKSSQQNIIENVGFSLIATEGKKQSMIAGATSFDVKAGVAEDSFTSIDSVDDAKIQEWIESRLGADRVTQMKEELKENIARLLEGFDPIGE